MRRYSPKRGFNSDATYYIGLHVDKTLDATTVTANNFTVMPVGTSTQTELRCAKYFPQRGEIRLYFDEKSPDFNQLHRVTGIGVRDCDGDAFELDTQAYMLLENPCALYDVSIAELLYLRDGIPIYTTSADGCITVYVRVVNSALTEKKVALLLDTEDNGDHQTVALCEELCLKPDESVSLSYNLAVRPEQTISVRIEEIK